MIGAFGILQRTETIRSQSSGLLWFGLLPLAALSHCTKGALDEIQFLANSANRVQVLYRLNTGPASRRELQEETEVSRSTTARVLNEAETWGWVTSAGSEYQITSVGEVMVSEFCTYVEAVEGIKRLGKALDWLPEPVYELDFRCFRHANITTPTEDNPTAMFDRGLEYIRTADKYRGLTQNSLSRST